MRVVIAGAGMAGLRAAEAVRKAGFAGEIAVLGEEPHMPYNRPPLGVVLIGLAGRYQHYRSRIADSIAAAMRLS